MTVQDSPRAYELADRYRAYSPPMLLTGVQAIARLLVEQHALDVRNGRNCAQFVSGYQGSPLAGVDRLLQALPDVLERSSVTFVPALNEELAATSVWGSQVCLPEGRSAYDGVVGIWYGKGPGVDRATDALRHLNLWGVNPTGGVLLLVGDDPAAKSSTVPAVSERSLEALGIPVLFPRNATEVIELGLHGIAMSRASGCVVALKIVADVADGAWVVDRHVSGVEPVVPEVIWDGSAYRYVQLAMEVNPDKIVAAEASLVGPRSATVASYVLANHLNTIELDSPSATLGFVAAGTTFDALRQAFTDLNLDDDDLGRAGIRLIRLGLVAPVEPTLIRAAAKGLQTLVVVEDKVAFVEKAIRAILYDSPERPDILGKTDRAGNRLIPAHGELTSSRLASVLRTILAGRVELEVERTRTGLPLLSTSRVPYFCSGCPHNRSTAIPAGSLAAGGIGCHAMVTTSLRRDSAVVGLTQMGGEGSQWIGQAPFTDIGHIFQNIGDGTFFHSGQLAVQACIAAGVNITYKILYNNVVAMTGAQDAEGALDVGQLTHKLAIEGVAKIIICADDTSRHRRRDLAPNSELWHRDRLDEAQRVLRGIPGVTALIYDQQCAADARRKRKRGQAAPPENRVVINQAVCEGCGDCGTKSNCLSVQPVETEFGRKTAIDQESCNSDYTCLDGDCPSFVTVRAARRGSKKKRAAAPQPPVPQPPVVADPSSALPEGGCDVFMAGIGGTGIVTVNQVLATAALLAGYQVHALDQTGLSQKAGAVTGHLRFGRDRHQPSSRVSSGAATSLLAFDLLTMATDKNLAYGDPDRTIAVASTSPTPTGPMIYDPSITYPEIDELIERLRTASHELHAFDALAASERLFGGTSSANFLLVGAAHQSGALPIPAVAIEEAIALNGVSVTENTAAFRWGRTYVADPDAFARATGPGDAHAPTQHSSVGIPPTSSLAGEVRHLVERRLGELVAYQNRRLANSYLETVETIWAAERAVTERTSLSEAAARYLHKLLAYKDEYEVARLLTSPEFRSDTDAQVLGRSRVSFQLHPPVLRALGRGTKVSFGPGSHWMLRALAKLKFLRGTDFDPFGYTEVRRMERTLAAHYDQLCRKLAAELTFDNYDIAVEIAAAPDLVRGYESVKLASVARYVERLRSLGVSTPAPQAPPQRNPLSLLR